MPNLNFGGGEGREGEGMKGMGKRVKGKRKRGRWEVMRQEERE